MPIFLTLLTPYFSRVDKYTFTITSKDSHERGIQLILSSSGSSHPETQVKYTTRCSWLQTIILSNFNRSRSLNLYQKTAKRFLNWPRYSKMKQMAPLRITNVEAGILALVAPSLLRKRGRLMEEARKKVVEKGYAFVNGKSHSK